MLLFLCFEIGGKGFVRRKMGEVARKIWENYRNVLGKQGEKLEKSV